MWFSFACTVRALGLTGILGAHCAALASCQITSGHPQAETAYAMQRDLTHVDVNLRIHTSYIFLVTQTYRDNVKPAEEKNQREPPG